MVQRSKDLIAHTESYSNAELCVGDSSVCMYVCGGQRTTLGAVPQAPSTLCFETGPLTGL